MGWVGWASGTSTKFISGSATSDWRLDKRFDMICAIMASEFASTGRRETSSFQGLVTGKICIAETTASALVVLNKMELVTTGKGPRMRPSWLMRSAKTVVAENQPAITMGRTRRIIMNFGSKSAVVFGKVDAGL